MIRNLKKMIRDEEAVGTILCLGAMSKCLNPILAPTPQGPSTLETLLAMIS